MLSVSKPSLGICMWSQVKKRRRLIAPVVALFATHLRSHCPDKKIASLPDRRSDCDTPSQVPSGLLGRNIQRSCPSESSDLSLREERALEFNRIRKSSEINLHFQSAAISFLYSFYLLSVAHSSPRSAHAPSAIACSVPQAVSIHMSIVHALVFGIALRILALLY